MKFHSDESLSRTQFFEWFEGFKVAKEETGDNHRPGRPSISKIEANIRKSRFNPYRGNVENMVNS